MKTLNNYTKTLYRDLINQTYKYHHTLLHIATSYIYTPLLSLSLRHSRFKSILAQYYKGASQEFILWVVVTWMEFTGVPLSVVELAPFFTGIYSKFTPRATQAFDLQLLSGPHYEFVSHCKHSLNTLFMRFLRRTSYHTFIAHKSGYSLITRIVGN